MGKRWLFVACAILAASISAYAQITVKGKVFNIKGEAICGAAVVVVGTRNGAITDLDGSFKISNISSQAVLEVSCHGYATKQEAVKGRGSVTIVLYTDSDQRKMSRSDSHTYTTNTPLRNSPQKSFYRRYAEDGDAEAMCRLADCLIDGTDGERQNYQEAVSWYVKAMRKGYLPAYVALANCYRNGIGVMVDENEALRLIYTAASKGSSQAQYYYAMEQKYKNREEYFNYLGKAVDQNYLPAFIEYARLFVYGDSALGVEASAERARFWINKVESMYDNSLEATSFLGDIYLNGLGVEEDMEKGLNYHMKAAEAGYAYSIWTIGLLNHYAEKYNAAFSYFQSAAEKGYPPAYHQIGYYYYSGLGVEGDFHKAKEYFELGVKHGIEISNVYLGLIYMFGLGVDIDDNKSLSYLKAGNSLPFGSYCLGYYYSSREDFDNAVKYYKIAAEKGYIDSYIALYEVYMLESYQKRNPSLAIQYLRQASSSGEYSASGLLGMHYIKGDHVLKDRDRGLSLLNTAAENGDATSCCHLSIFYYDGEYVEKNHSLSVKYATQAIKNEDNIDNTSLLAQVYRNLGVCYRFGRGVAQDADLADYYTEKAAEYGDEKARKTRVILNHK